MKPGKFREDYIAIVLRELLKGLDYLHGEGKLHRDIKGKLCCLLCKRIQAAHFDDPPF